MRALRYMAFIIICLILISFLSSCGNAEMKDEEASSYSWTNEYNNSDLSPYRISTADSNHVWMGSGLSIYSLDGSSWIHQFGVGDLVTKISALDSYNAWAVDSIGKIYSFDGESWSEMYDSGAYLYDVEGLPNGHAWVSGFHEVDEEITGEIYWYDGSDWHCQLQVDSNMFCVTAIDDEHVWAGGEDGIWFYDGNTWAKQYDEYCSDIDAVDINHIWAVGGNTVYYFDGHNWNIQYEARTRITDIVAVDLHNIWVTGCAESGIEQICLFYDGSSWIEQDWIDEEGLLWIYDISASDKDNAWLVGANYLELDVIYRFDGKTWTRQYEQEGGFSSIAALDRDHAWATTYGGYIYFYDGIAWSKIYRIDTTLYDIYALDPNHVWAVGSRSILFFDGTSWSEQLNVVTYFLSVHGIDERHVWAASNGGIYFYNGEEWVKISDDIASTIQAIDEDHFWTDKGEYSYDGSSWTLQQAIESDNLDALSANAVWLLKEKSLKFYDGSSIRDVLEAPEKLTSISVIDPEHIWVIGRTWRTVKNEEGLAYNDVSGTIYFYDGASMSAQYTATIGLFRDIEAVEADNIWATGMNSIYHGTKE